MTDMRPYVLPFKYFINVDETMDWMPDDHPKRLKYGLASGEVVTRTRIWISKTWRVNEPDCIQPQFILSDSILQHFVLHALMRDIDHFDVRGEKTEESMVGTLKWICGNVAWAVDPDYKKCWNGEHKVYVDEEGVTKMIDYYDSLHV